MTKKAKPEKAQKKTKGFGSNKDKVPGTPPKKEDLATVETLLTPMEFPENNE